MVERSLKEELFWISCISLVIAVCPSPTGGNTEDVFVKCYFKDFSKMPIKEKVGQKRNVTRTVQNLLLCQLECSLLNFCLRGKVLHTKIVEGSMMHVSRPVSYPPSPEFS
jgi:hypothetical protein